jgi:hypothetical protein
LTRVDRPRRGVAWRAATNKNEAKKSREKSRETAIFLFPPQPGSETRRNSRRRKIGVTCFWAI